MDYPRKPRKPSPLNVDADEEEEEEGWPKAAELPKPLPKTAPLPLLPPPPPAPKELPKVLPKLGAAGDAFVDNPNPTRVNPSTTNVSVHKRNNDPVRETARESNQGEKVCASIFPPVPVEPKVGAVAVDVLDDSELPKAGACPKVLVCPNPLPLPKDGVEVVDPKPAKGNVEEEEDGLAAPATAVVVLEVLLVPGVENRLPVASP